MADFFVENVPPPTEAPTPTPNIVGEIRSAYDTNLCLDLNINNGELYMYGW